MAPPKKKVVTDSKIYILRITQSRKHPNIVTECYFRRPKSVEEIQEFMLRRFKQVFPKQAWTFEHIMPGIPRDLEMAHG